MKTEAYLKVEAARAASMPSDAVLVDSPNNSCAVYLRASGRVSHPFAATGFVGRKSKYRFNLCFETEIRRDEYVSKFIKSNEEVVVKNKAKKSVERKMQVGDVLVSSWGWEQTNIDFYIVTALVGKSSVKIAEIGSKRDYDGQYMSGTAYPDVTNIVGEEMTKRVKSYNQDGSECVNISSFQTAFNARFTIDVDGNKVYEGYTYSTYA